MPKSEVTTPESAERIRLVVLFGGRSAEHDVSCVSARHVIAAADPTKYRIEPIGIDRGGLWHRDQPLVEAPDRLEAVGEVVDALPAIMQPDMPTVVFPVLHGPMGEDGTMQGLLELADVAYVGAGVLASALCMDKVAAKAHLSAHGVTQGKYTWLDADGAEAAEFAAAADRVIGELGLPLFVKPANMGSSVGVSRATNSEEVVAAIELAARYDRIVIIEEEIRGREIEVAVLGNERPEASVPGEIVPGADFYDYSDKYDDGADLRIPAPLEPDEVQAAQTAAVAAYQALRVEGLARVDFFYEADGRGWLVNELNTMPGFTPISMYPKLWAETGLPYEKLIDRLVELAVERHERKRRHSDTSH